MYHDSWCAQLIICLTGHHLTESGGIFLSVFDTSGGELWLVW